MKTFKEMEDDFYRAAKAELVAGLEKCPENSHKVFKLMYAHKHLDWSIKQVAAHMGRDKLAWAMSQVKTTIDKNTP